MLERKTRKEGRKEGRKKGRKEGGKRKEIKEKKNRKRRERNELGFPAASAHSSQFCPAQGTKVSLAHMARTP